MKDQTQHWADWIHAIVNDLLEQRCPEEILAHIQKHAGTDLQRHMFERDNGGTDWRIWSASMHNLLAIFDSMYLHHAITTPELLERLRAHYRSSPKTRTPEPKR